MITFIVLKVFAISSEVVSNFFGWLIRANKTNMATFNQKTSDKLINANVNNIPDANRIDCIQLQRKIPFSHLSFCVTPIETMWGCHLLLGSFVTHFSNTRSFVLEMWKWNERRECLVSLAICSPICALFHSLGSLGESLIFSPSSWVPAAERFVSVILSRSAELLTGPVPASPWKRKREREGARQGGHWSQGLSATASIFRGITHFGLQGCSREE